MLKLIILLIFLYGAYCLIRNFTKRSKTPSNCSGKCVGCPQINRCLTEGKPELKNHPNFGNNQDDNDRPTRF